MSTQRYVPANGHALRQRQLELGISDRDLSRRTGLGQTTVRSILLKSQLSTSTNVAELNRCLSETGLTYGELLDVDRNGEPDDSPDADVTVLAGVLIGDRRMHANEQLALALGWTFERLDTAATSLDCRLQPTGLKVHQNTNGLTIRSASDKSSDALQKLGELRDDAKGIKQGTARTLFAVYTGTLSTGDLPNDVRVELGELNNRGAIAIGSDAGKRMQLSDNCAFAFDAT